MPGLQPGGRGFKSPLVHHPCSLIISFDFLFCKNVNIVECEPFTSHGARGSEKHVEEQQLVHVEKKSGMVFWICDECGFGYTEMETAQECERYCKTYGISSYVITKKAVLMPAN